MFESEEEKRRKATSLFVFIVGGIIIVMVIMVLTSLWAAMKPLPQTTECTTLGYQAGVIKNGELFCFNECDGNEITDCRQSCFGNSCRWKR